MADVILLLFVALLSARPQVRADTTTVIQGYANGLAAIRAANPDVHLSLGQDGAVPGQRVLMVDYPAPSADPAGRDVRCNADATDWRAGRAIEFQVNPDHAIRLSVSFMDRNGVVYSERPDLEGGKWQRIRIAFDAIRPNPYFQPPNAITGRPLDVSDVKFIAFAPQDPAAGRVAVGPFMVAP